MMLGALVVASTSMVWYVVLIVVVLVLLGLAIRGNWFVRTNAFLADVRTELKKVSWPTRGELWNATGVVIVSTALVTVFVVIVDIVLTRIMGLFF